MAGSCFLTVLVLIDMLYTRCLLLLLLLLLLLFLFVSLFFLFFNAQTPFVFCGAFVCMCGLCVCMYVCVCVCGLTDLLHLHLLQDLGVKVVTGRPLGPDMTLETLKDEGYKVRACRAETQHTAYNAQHTTHSTQHTTHNPQHTTHNPQRTAHSTQHTAHTWTHAHTHARTPCSSTRNIIDTHSVAH